MRTVETLVSKTTGKVTYRVRFRRGISETTGKPIQSSEPFTTKAKAEKFAKELDVLGVDGALDRLYAGPELLDLPTLNQVAEDHWANLFGVEPGTIETYKALWSRTWHTRLGRFPVDEITVDAIGRAFEDLGRTYSQKSLKNQRGLLSGVMGRAVAKKLIPSNPVAEIKRLPRGKSGSGGKEAMRILAVEEFTRICESVPEHYRPLLRFLWGTGARPGEAVALQGRDILWPTVTIRRALKYHPNREHAEMGPPKNRKARTVVLPEELKDELVALKKKAGTDGLVFPHASGELLQLRQLHSQAWTPATLGMTPKPRIYDLRHSHASWLLARGVPIHVVSARLGHSSINITVDTYGHLVPDAQKWAAQAASYAFAATPPSPALPPAPDHQQVDASNSDARPDAGT